MRKIIPITKKLNRVEKLIKEKGLSERDLILILKSYRLYNLQDDLETIRDELQLKQNWCRTKLPDGLTMDNLVVEEINQLDYIINDYVASHEKVEKGIRNAVYSAVCDVLQNTSDDNHLKD